MTSRQSRFSLAVGCLLLAVAAYTQAATVNVTLVSNADGTCAQKGSKNPAPNAPSQFVLVDHGDSIRYTGAVDSLGAPTTFDVRFDPPFGDLGQGNAAHPVTTSPFQGEPGDTVNYHSVTIGNQPCFNGKSLGIVMR